MISRKSLKRRPTIGVLIGMLEEGCQTKIWNCIADFAEELDVNIIFVVGKALSSPYGFDSQHHIIYNMADRRNMDGLVIMSGTLGNFITDGELKKFCDRFRPLPMACIALSVEGVPSVLVDNKSGLHEAFDHLIKDHGYKRIAYIKGPEGHQEADVRFESYKEALKKYHIPFDPALVTPGNFVYNKGYNAIKILLDERKVKFDAVVAANDDMALGAFKCLQERGIKVPRDVGLIGFDDINIARNLNPPLTTVRQPLYEQARKALEIVLAMINGKKTPEQIYLPTKLVIRQSCGCFSLSLTQADSNQKEFYTGVSSHEKNLKINQKRILSKTIKELEQKGISNRFLSLWIEKLLNAMILSLKNKKIENDKFLYIVSDVPIGLMSNVSDEFLWQSVINSLRDEIHVYIKDDDSLSLLKIMCQKALIYIGDMMLRPDPFHSIYEQHIVWTLREVSSILTTTFELNELLEAIAKGLPQLGILKAYIFLYNDEPKKKEGFVWDIPEWSRLILAFNNEGRLSVSDKESLFPTLNILPDKLKSHKKSRNMILMPLFFRNEQFGYILFEMGTRLATTYETLRYQISNSLKSAFLFKKQRETEESRIAAKTADKIKSQFLANMSHEIRTPMNAIIGFTGLLLEDEREAEKKDKLKVIMRAGNNLLEIINDILDFSKMEEGKIDFEKINFSLKTIINDVRKIFLIKAEEKGILFNVEIDKTLPELVFGDERRVNQIILNLVSNAFKFTKEGSVSITCKYLNQTASISVIDTGIGITKEKFDTIFSSFSQADPTTTREFGGTGLGLAISKGLTEKMGGKIYFESEAGKGSAFYVELPLPGSGEILSGKKCKNSYKDEQMVQQWLKSAEGDSEIKNIILKAIKKLPDQIQDVEAVISTNDHNMIKKVIHDIKGVSGNLGIIEIYDIFYKMNQEIEKDVFSVHKLKELLNGAREIVKRIPDYYFTDSTVRESMKPVKFRILVAEDNEMNQELVGALLKKLKVEYDFALNGRITLDKLKDAVRGNNEYHLLLLDMQMPVMDGLEVLKNLRNDKELKNLYVIALTAHAMKGDALKYYKAGCNDYISKPINKEDFRRKIIELMSRIKEKEGRSIKEAGNKKELALAINEQESRELDEIIRELKFNAKIFNQEKVLGLAARLGRFSSHEFFNEIKRKLEIAAREFDDESIISIIDELEGLKYEI